MSCLLDRQWRKLTSFLWKIKVEITLFPRKLCTYISLFDVTIFAWYYTLHIRPCEDLVLSDHRLCPIITSAYYHPSFHCHLNGSGAIRHVSYYLYHPGKIIHKESKIGTVLYTGNLFPRGILLVSTRQLVGPGDHPSKHLNIEIILNFSHFN